MADLIAMLSAAASVDGGAAVDPNFNQTTLLLHGDGTNGAQNNTFLDSSTPPFTITRNGNTTQGTFSPFSEGWSNYFDGSGDYLTVADNAAFQVGSGAFTLECWVYLTTTGTDIRIYSYQPASGTASVMNLYRLATNVFALALRDSGGSGYTEYTTTSTVLANTWYHVAAARDASGNIAIWVNGARENSTASSTQSIASGLPGIGGRANGTQIITGYLSNLRLVKATDVYGASNTSITVPTSPLTSDANTSLLTCQSNRFVDNSGTPKTITVNGNTSVQPFSPFLPSAAYDPSVNGGSGYFDGTGDYLSVADNAAFTFGSSDFCVEAWVYTSGASGANLQIAGSHEDGVAASWLFYIRTDNKIRILVNSSIFAESSSAIPLNAWTHIAGVRNGSTLYVYVNGVQAGSAGFASSVNSNSYPITVGSDQNGDETLYTGWISSLRIVKGDPVYTSAFTPPTAPLTAIANTSLLLLAQNAGIFDNTGKNNLETVGNAQIDTSVVKYGTGSMEFDGTGDYCVLPSNPNLALGSGDFTIEMWLYSTTTGAAQNILDARLSSTGYTIQKAATNEIYFYSEVAASTIVEAALTANQWVHVAIVRSSGTITLYLDGTSADTGANTSNYTSQIAVIGARFSKDQQYYTGYLDDFRITKGVARYTAAFTPPTAAFPDL